MAEPHGDKFWRLFAAIWLAVGVPFLAIGLWAGWDEPSWARLPGDAVLTRGEVLAKDRKADGRPVVRYRFAGTAASPVEGTAVVEEEAWMRLEPNGPIRVMFLPEAPRIHLVEGHLRQGNLVMAAIFIGLGGLLSTLGAAIVVRSFTLAREARAAPATAKPAAAPAKARKDAARARRTKAEKRERRAHRAAVTAAPVPAWKNALKTFVNVMLFLVAIFAAAVVVEIFPQLGRVESWMERHELALMAATGGACLLGIGLLVGSMLLRLMDDSAAHRRGKHPRASMEFSIGALKRSAQERRDFPWAAAAGAILIAFGTFGITIALAPMALKLVLAAVFGYAVVRTCRAIARA